MDVHENGTRPSVAIVNARLQHLSGLETVNDQEMGDWVDIRLDRWLADWTLRNGYEQTARAIATNRGIEVGNPFEFFEHESDRFQKLVDLDLFAEVQRIESALKGQSCTEALAWCSENKNALRKNKVCLSDA